MTGTTTQMPPLSRRGFLAGGLGLAGVGLLAGCANGGGSGSGGGSTTSLRATWWGDTNLNSAVTAALTSFGKTHHAQVAGESIAFTGYWDKLATETSGGNPPDLEMQAASYLPEYGSRKALLDLTPYVGKQLDMSTVDSGIRKFGMVDGKLLGVVAATNAMGLVFDETKLKDLGVTAPTDQMSWDALASLAKKVHSAQPGTYGLQDSGGDLIMFDVFIRSTGKNLFDAAGKVAATDSDLRDWFSWWDGLRKAGGVPPAAMTAQSTAIQTSPMVTGKAAMGFAWTQDFISYMSSMKDTIGVVLTPQGGDDEGLWINAASLWSVSAKTKNPDAAVKLVDYLINDKTAITTLSATLGGPPTAKARTQLAPTLKGADKLAVDYMTKVASHSRPLNRLWPAGFAPLRTEFATLNQAVGFGKSSVSEAIDSFWKTAAQNNVK